ncbi:MAG: hypothetical protein M3306_13240 [Actinomycetota bacterium]|nr:hypothetical protein [Actinomycetota bacterium]
MVEEPIAPRPPSRLPSDLPVGSPRDDGENQARINDAPPGTSVPAAAAIAHEAGLIIHTAITGGWKVTMPLLAILVVGTMCLLAAAVCVMAWRAIVG